MNVEDRLKEIAEMRTQLQVSRKAGILVMLWPDEMDLVLEALEAVDLVESRVRWKIEYRQYDLEEESVELTDGWEEWDDTYDGWVSENAALEHVAELKESLSFFSTRVEYRVVAA